MANSNPCRLSTSPQCGPIPGMSVTRLPPMGVLTKWTCFLVASHLGRSKLIRIIGRFQNWGGVGGQELQLLTSEEKFKVRFKL